MYYDGSNLDKFVKAQSNDYATAYREISSGRKRSHWTELNIERCADLERRGLMTDAGRKALNEALQRIDTHK